MALSYEDALLGIERDLFSAPSVATWTATLDNLLAYELANPLALDTALRGLVVPKLFPAARVAVLSAAQVGLQTAGRTVYPEINDGPARTALLQTAGAGFKPSDELKKMLGGLDSDQTVAILAARTKIAAGASSSEALAEIRGARQKLNRDLTGVTNMAGNEATMHVAKTAGYPVVWVAERNACVVCLAYSGQTVAVDEAFPSDLTYGKIPKGGFDAVTKPPRHGYCRCHLEILKSPAYADALKREADRSVLRGFALPSESKTVRIAAAKKLLEDPNLVAPKSVVRYATKSVKNGAFDPLARVPGNGGHNFPTPPTQGPSTKPKPPKNPPTPPPSPAPKAPPKPTNDTRTAAEIRENTAKLKETLARVKAERAGLKAGVPDLTKAKTTTELLEGWAVKHPSTPVIGFDVAGLNFESVKGALVRVSDLLGKYPDAPLASITAAPAGARMKNTLAFVRYSPPRYGGRASIPTMTIHTSVLRASQAERTAAEAHMRKTGGEGHFHELQGEGVTPIDYTVTHEFGHVLDVASNLSARKVVPYAVKRATKAAGIAPGTAEEVAFRRANISLYGTASSGEGWAEAFADVELNGAAASPTSKEIYKTGLAKYEENHL